MATAVSSWREERYRNFLPRSGLARYSQIGAHSDPGDAKIRSTAISASTCRKASAPHRPLMSVLVSTGLDSLLELVAHLVVQIDAVPEHPLVACALARPVDRHVLLLLGLAVL